MIVKQQHSNNRMSRSVKHGDVIYLCGPVGAGTDIAAQTKDCLDLVERLDWRDLTCWLKSKFQLCRTIFTLYIK